MKAKGILLLVMTLQCIAAMAQHYPDNVLNGVNGRVKRLATTTYKDVVLVKNQWQPQDTGYFSHKSVHYYNGEGYIDSMDIWLRLPYGDSVTHTHIVYKYENGLKKFARVYTGNIAVETETIEWPDSTGYVVIGFNLAGRMIRKSIFTLAETHREIKSEFFYYDTSGRVRFHQLWEMEIGENGWATTVTETDKILNQAISYRLLNSDSDDYGNPLRTIRAIAGRPQPERILLRAVEYY